MRLSEAQRRARQRRKAHQKRKADTQAKQPVVEPWRDRVARERAERERRHMHWHMPPRGAAGDLAILGALLGMPAPRTLLAEPLPEFGGFRLDGGKNGG